MSQAIDVATRHRLGDGIGGATSFCEQDLATLRGERDIAIGNLLGSSIYNILLILGVTCLVSADGLQLPPELVRVDIPIMVAATLICIPIFISGRRVSRVEGGAMVGAYVAFLAFLLTTQT